MREVWERMVEVVIGLSPWLRRTTVHELEQAEAHEAMLLARVRQLEMELGKELLIIQRSTRLSDERTG